MPEFTARGRVLEYHSDTFEGNPYANVKLRSMDIANNAILKYKVDVKRVGDLSNLIDKDVQFSFEIVRGSNDAAVVKVVKCEAI